MNRETLQKALDLIRAWPLAAVGAFLVLVVLLADLARVDVLIWGLTKVAVLAYAGYWIDRWLFPYARPHDHWFALGAAEHALPDEITVLPQIRRAIIIAACILTATLIP
jgi:hypothetical protein